MIDASKKRSADGFRYKSGGRVILFFVEVSTMTTGQNVSRSLQQWTSFDLYNVIGWKANSN